MLFALFAGVFRYVDQHFYTAETFLEDNAELGANADIREFLFQGFRTEIIQLADGDVEEPETSGTVADRLDDDVDLADPVTAERIARDETIEAILLEVFDSDLYDQTFTNALTRTQLELVRSAELEPEALLGDKGEIFFDMRGLYEVLWPAFGADELTAEISRNELPNDYGIFKVGDRDTTINPLWTLMQRGPDLRGLMLLGAIVSFAGAVVIADRRPSTAIQFGGGLVGVAIVVIVIIFLIRFIVPLLAGGASASPVVANYVSNTWPLIQMMIRLAIIGVVLAVVGAIARYIWPDNWVYSSVSDERGVRSVRRRRGEPEPTPQPQQRQAAAVPVGYSGYPQQQQPYGGYPQQQWGQQPYPGAYPPGYMAPYPTGPFAQPAIQQPQSQHYTSPGQPTVPVTPVHIDPGNDAGDLVPPAAPPFDAKPSNLPDDAAQIVPRVVATTDTTLDASTAAQDVAGTSKSTVVEIPSATPTTGSAKDSDVDVVTEEPATRVNKAVDATADAADEPDEWATENDW